ncbi:MAG: ribonuclease HII [Minisyncoccia bacterium]
MESKFLKCGYKKILAIDEVGRGALAGPFYISGVLIDKKIYEKIKELNIKDSKRLNNGERNKIFKIVKNIVKYKIVKFSSKEIDKIGIGECFKNGIIILKKELKSDIVLVDGKDIRLKNKKNIRFIVDGDEKLISIGLASIIGKVLRDKYMEKLGKFYPIYKFEKNKGYGTKEHIKIIKKWGITKHHRLSFLKNFLKYL